MQQTITQESLPIIIDPDIMSGAPVFAGTRVPVRTLFDYLSDGCTVAEFLDNFPTVSSEAAFKLLEYAASRVTIKASYA